MDANPFIRTYADQIVSEIQEFVMDQQYISKPLVINRRIHGFHASIFFFFQLDKWDRHAMLDNLYLGIAFSQTYHVLVDIAKKFFSAI